MIDFIEGRIEYIETDSVIISTNGIGYRVFSGNPFVYRENGSEVVRIYTHHYVREDAIFLYGFRSRDERNLFRKLLDVSGIGPKGALAITSAGMPQQIISAIQLENIDFLTRFPGIGKKTAQRIVLDLKDKLKGAIHKETLMEQVEENPKEEELSLFGAFQEPRQEAIEALTALGYSDNEIQKVMKKLEKDGADLASTDKIVKRALQLFLTT
ncbi:Holliday junction branch migration protein RuvA [Aneurinibacillus terranovensis]|uniref:Holliday junction branch migration protein RuvA n=1 Tax=Aneurinibacillus terranovensis TaxID=278991 RepID=UPI0003F764FC|nr:Holliday junction branch migration protein RuvA [Aneurinibacillus terranovensis]